MSNATLKQRMYLMGLYDKLKWKDKKASVRSMTVEQASAAIAVAKKILDERGSEPDEESLI
jgi:hypothetical protein